MDGDGGGGLICNGFTGNGLGQRIDCNRFTGNGLGQRIDLQLIYWQRIRAAD